MREYQAGNVKVIEYGSLTEFYDYICKTPTNVAFSKMSYPSSTHGSEAFTGTKSFEEAVALFKHGWSDMATKLVQKLKVIESKAEPTMQQRNVLGVAGYQAIVPLYLQGVPNNMVQKQMVPIKQKVITLNKSIDYNGGVDKEKIVDESVKAMQIIKKLEVQGYRCNLNIVLGTSEADAEFAVRVRIKSANEKLNVSKLAFPLVHPSMLRRLFFRWIEVYPEITSSFLSGYGRPAKSQQLRQWFPNANGYLLPNFIVKDVSKIKGIEDLEKL